MKLYGMRLCRVFKKSYTEVCSLKQLKDDVWTAAVYARNSASVRVWQHLIYNIWWPVRRNQWDSVLSSVSDKLIGMLSRRPA